MLNLLLNLIGASIEAKAGPIPPSFLCTTLNGTTQTVSTDTVTACDPIFVENGGVLLINTGVSLTQNNP